MAVSSVGPISCRARGRQRAGMAWGQNGGRGPEVTLRPGSDGAFSVWIQQPRLLNWAVCSFKVGMPCFWLRQRAFGEGSLVLSPAIYLILLLSWWQHYGGASRLGWTQSTGLVLLTRAGAVSTLFLLKLMWNEIPESRKIKTIPSIDCFNGEIGMASCCNLRGNSNIWQVISGERSVSCRSKVSLGNPLFSGQKGAVMFRIWQFAAQKCCWWSNPRVSAVQWLTF